jgi:hypothetical protein
MQGIKSPWRKQSGENAIIDLLEGRVENAEQTLTNNIALDVYSNGTLH